MAFIISYLVTDLFLYCYLVHIQAPNFFIMLANIHVGGKDGHGL